MISHTPFISVLLIWVGYSSGISITAENQSRNDHPTDPTGSNLSNFLIGGSPAGPTEYKFIALFVFNYKYGGQCHGAIIDPLWVLTSADCANTEPDRIAVGVYDITQNGAQNISVAQYFVHPNWNADSEDNNIGLIKMQEAFTLGGDSGAEPIEYARTGAVPPPDATVASWGYNTTLQEVTMAFTSNEECLPYYANFVEPVAINCNQVCYGGGPDSAGSICYEDWGAPLFSNDDIPILIGISSFSDCNSTIPSIFTKVSAFTFWIQTTMADNSS